jgi:hypothetical protein
MSEENSDDVHWSVQHLKTQTKFIPAHAFVLAPITYAGFNIVQHPYRAVIVLVLWIAADRFLHYKQMTLVSLITRFRIRLSGQVRRRNEKRKYQRIRRGIE